MKSIAAGAGAALILALLLAIKVTGAPGDKPGPKDLGIKSEARNPWTNLNLNNGANNFQFAVVSDRTGGRRPGIFKKAVGKLNLLQPEFVVSVGDLIEGYSEDPGQWALEWSEFESNIHNLQMPFFLCPGNHDLANVPMRDEWKRKFGRTYYEFRYKDVLFLVINTEDPPVYTDKTMPYRISDEQQKWAADVLSQNADVRWTFVFLHKPTWSYPAGTDHEKCGWTGIENALQGRKYTVFAGHKHNYGKFHRKGMEYYMLATTGGASKMRGIADGEFDHFTWITIRNDRPVIANVMLDGIENDAIRVLPDPESQAKPAGK